MTTYTCPKYMHDELWESNLMLLCFIEGQSYGQV